MRVYLFNKVNELTSFVQERNVRRFPALQHGAPMERVPRPMTSLDAMSANQTETLDITLRLCGLPNTHDVSFDTDQEGSRKERDVETSVLSQFNVTSHDYYILFHREDEPCHVQRPFEDIFLHLRGGKSSHQTLCLHLFRNLYVPKTERMGRAVGQKTATGATNDGKESTDAVNPLQKNGTTENEDRIQSINETTGQSSDAAAQTQALHVHIEVEYHFIQDLQLGIHTTSKTWAETAIEFPMTATFVDLINELRSETLDRFGTAGFDQDDQVSFRVHMPTLDQRSMYVHLDQNGKRHIHHLSDLFNNPQKDKREFKATVVLGSSALLSIPRTTDQVLTDDWALSYRYYLVGSRKQTSAVGNEASGEAKFPQQCVLVGFYNDEHNDKPGRELKLLEVLTFTLNDVVMGDCDHGGIIAKFGKFDKLDERYGDIQGSKEAVHKFLQNEQNVSVKNELMNLVPTAPTYSFNQSAPDLDGLGMDEWPQREIKVTVRFISIWMQDERVKWRPLSTLGHIQVTKRDTWDDIANKLDQELERQGSTDAKELLRLRSEGGPYDFWVLPQRSGVSKLFWHHDGNLTKFVDPEKADQRLFMEAHVTEVPPDQSERASAEKEKEKDRKESNVAGERDGVPAKATMRRRPKGKPVP